MVGVVELVILAQDSRLYLSEDFFYFGGATKTQLFLSFQIVTKKRGLKDKKQISYILLSKITKQISNTTNRL